MALASCLRTSGLRFSRVVTTPTSRPLALCVRAAAGKSAKAASPAPKDANIVGKGAIVEKLQEKGLKKQEAIDAFETVLGAVEEALVAGKRVTIVGFGSFEVRQRSARTGRNPKTGEPLEIAASKAPAFKASPALKDKVNGKVVPPKPKAAAPAKAAKPAPKDAKPTKTASKAPPAGKKASPPKPNPKK